MTGRLSGGVSGPAGHGIAAESKHDHDSQQLAECTAGRGRQGAVPSPLQVFPGLGMVAASGVIALLMLPLAQIQVGICWAARQQPEC